MKVKDKASFESAIEAFTSSLKEISGEDAEASITLRASDYAAVRTMYGVPSGPCIILTQSGAVEIKRRQK